MKRSEIAFGVIKIPIDFVLTLIAFLMAYQLRPITDLIPGITLTFTPDEYPTFETYFQFSSISAMMLVIIFAFNQMYSLKVTSSISRELSKIFFSCMSWAMLIIMYFFITRTFPFSRLALIEAFTLTYFFISTGRVLIRTFQRYLLRYKIGVRNILIIGNNNITRELTQNLATNKHFHIIGTIEIKNENIPEQLEKYLKQHLDQIIQTSRSESGTEHILDFCREYHLEYSFVPDLLEVQRSNIDINIINDIPVISLKPTPLDGWGKVIKRSFDFIGAAIGCIILSPLLLATAISIKLDTRGPVIFNKKDNGEPLKRVGQHGKPFTFHKFRSMHPGTDNLRYTTLAEKNIRKNSPLVKIENDPRVTHMGRLIRKTSIDEFPQLWNVLCGDMSLVGPRPHLPEEVAKYKKHHKFVLTVKPGITGLSQIGGRSNLDFEEEVKLDTYYIQNWSLWMDIKIILKTIGAVAKGYRE